MERKVIKLLVFLKCICLIVILFGLCEFETKTAYASDTKITGVTADASSYLTGWPASDAVDDAAAESWWTTNIPGECWLRLELDRVYYIDRWYVINFGNFHAYDPIYDANNTRDYKLQSSMNGYTWTDVDVVNNNTADITNRTVTPFTAKYVRIYIVHPVQDTSDALGCGAIVDFEVFATAPVVTSVAVPASGTYTAGQTLTFTVNYSAEVAVTGTPYIPVTIGTKTVNAVYTSGTWNTLTFQYTVQSGDYDADGITLGSINTNGGTIRDYASNSANLTLNNAGTTSGITVDARTKHNISISSGLAGGSITASKTSEAAGETITLTVTPASGKQLKAGSLKYNYNGTDYVITGTSFTMPEGNITISAEFEDIPHTVTIGSLTGGNITTDKAEAAKNETVNLTISPATGMQLKAGSLKYNDGSNEVAITGTSFVMPDLDVTVTAEFETIPYTVQFNTNGIVTIPDKEVGYGEKITPPTADTPGVRQDGWYTDSGFTTIWNFDTNTVQQNMTLYLKYTPIGNVSFESNGGGTVSSQTVGSGEKVQEPAGVVRNGNTLDGWYLSSDFSGNRYDFNSVVTSTETNQMRTLYAKWIPVYDIIVDAMSGGSITANPVTAKAGDMITLTITPVTGKQLKAGSLKYNDGTNNVVITGTSFTMPAANVTVTAEFEDIPPTTYAVTVGALAGGSITTDLITAAAGDTITLTITPVTGKQLKAGSLKCNDGTNNVVITGTSFTMPAANVTVAAEFEDVPPITYTVTVGTLVGGSITANPTTATAGKPISLTVTPDTGKQLKVGSLKYNDGSNNIAVTGTSFTMPAVNVTVTAEFEDIPPTTYAVTVGTLAGGSITADLITAAAGNMISLTITPDTGKQLKAGSLKYNDGTNNVVITGTSFSMPAANITVMAEFENIPEVSTDTTLIRIVNPTVITGLMNGTAKSAAALGLPATVAIITSGGNINATLVWDVASCSYNQNSLSAQSFTVTGILTLPSGVVNTNNISLSVTISISVNQGTNPGSGSDGSNSDGVQLVGSNPATHTDTELPSIEGSEAKGWDSITQYISGNSTGSITVDMNGETTVIHDIFEVIKGKDIDLTFNLGNGIQWIINGTNIPESTDDSQLQDIDFNLSMDSGSIPTELLGTLTGTEQVQLSLAYSGNFGFTATLRMPLDEKYRGKFANLFYYNPVTNQLELQAVGVVDENGNVEFPFTHASDYVIAMSDTAMLDDEIDQITVTPGKKTLYIGGTKGNSVTIKTIIPEVIQKAVYDGLCDVTITYKSSNPKVAFVSNSGKIIAKKIGTATITATITINGLEKSFQTVIKVKRAYIKFTKSTKTMKLGETYTFQVTGYGIDADDIIFTTSQKSIVIINKLSGEAIAKSAGVDYVIVKAGDIEVKIKVSVQ
ncbi:MAG TPA: InlB B-repeat-containing protein [Mobilitalea sp.]|nr:InlB B-repeat-containing protein [Mobilitalea sp.]